MEEGGDLPLQNQSDAEYLFYSLVMHMFLYYYQWRSEGLQRPGANACINCFSVVAPPPPRISTPPCHMGLHGWRLWGSGFAPW